MFFAVVCVCGAWRARYMWTCEHAHYVTCLLPSRVICHVLAISRASATSPQAHLRADRHGILLPAWVGVEVRVCTHHGLHYHSSHYSLLSHAARCHWRRHCYGRTSSTCTCDARAHGADRCQSCWVATGTSISDSGTCHLLHAVIACVLCLISHCLHVTGAISIRSTCIWSSTSSA